MADMNFPTNPANGDVYMDYVYDSSSGWRSAVMVGAAPCGSIMPFAGSVVPAGWLLCDGSAVSRVTYSSLFAALGGISSPWGLGDGSTTFNLPDLRGRVPVGKNGGSFGTLAATGGVESVTLTEAQMPSHTHIQNAHNHSHRQWIFNGAGASGTHYGFGYASNTGGAADTSAAGSSGEIWFGNYPATATNQNTGGNQAHTNLQPYQVVNYIIKFSAVVSATDTELAVRMGQAEATVTSASATVSGYNSRLTTVEGTTSTLTSTVAALPKSGLVPVAPTSVVTTGGGSASVSGTGRVTISGGTGFFLNGIFTTAYRNYKIIIDTKTMGGAYQYMRFTYGDNNHTTAGAYYGGGFYRQASGTGIWSATNSGAYMDIGYTAGGGHAIIEVKAPRSGDTRASIMCLSSYSAGNHTQVWLDWMWDYADQFPGVYIYNSGAGYDAIVEVYGYNH